MSGSVPTLWSELSEYELCALVLSNSGDGSGLPSIAAGWDHWYEPEDLPEYSRDLGAAILALVSWGLVVVYNGMSPGDPLMSSEEIELAMANLQNWDYGDEGLDQVLWVSSTESGDRLLAPLRGSADVLKYFDMRHAEKRR
jgi:hypothetical protein